MDLFTRILLSILVVSALLFLNAVIRRLITRFARKRQYKPGRTYQVTGLLSLAIIIIGLLVLAGLWGLQGRGLLVFASSVLALIGVALFATWSILSNITAGLILFFSAPFRVGDRIRVLDGDNTVTGEISDMGVIYLRLKDKDRHRYTLPNNLLMQRTVILLQPDKELPWDEKHCR